MAHSLYANKENAMSEKQRVCPRAYKDAPHYLVTDADGRTYCPIERAAEREAAANAAGVATP
jgi:hypothetical protein